MRRHLSYANVMATIAVFIALGGSSYAAVKLTRNSVGERHIRAGAVGTSELRDGSVRLRDLRAADVRTLRGASTAGPAGPAGPTGPSGAAGPQGATGRSALEPLRSGETMTGAYLIDEHATAAAQDWRVAVPFPVSAPADVVDIQVDGVTGGETCTGSVSAPTAPPGALCIYREMTVNGTMAAGRGDRPRTGFIVELISAGVGDAFAEGTWAYTAP